MSIDKNVDKDTKVPRRAVFTYNIKEPACRVDYTMIDKNPVNMSSCVKSVESVSCKFPQGFKSLMKAVDGTAGSNNNIPILSSSDISNICASAQHTKTSPRTQAKPESELKCDKSSEISFAASDNAFTGTQEKPLETSISRSKLLECGMPHLKRLISNFEVQLEPLSVLQALGYEPRRKTDWDENRSFNPMKSRLDTYTWLPEATLKKLIPYKRKDKEVNKYEMVQGVGENSVCFIPKTIPRNATRDPPTMLSFKDVSAKLASLPPNCSSNFTDLTLPRPTPTLERSSSSQETPSAKTPCKTPDILSTAAHVSATGRPSSPDTDAVPTETPSTATAKTLPVNSNALAYRRRQIAIVQASDDYKIFKSKFSGNLSISEPDVNLRVSCSAFSKLIKAWKKEIRSKISDAQPKN